MQSIKTKEIKIKKGKKNKENPKSQKKFKNIFFKSQKNPFFFLNAIKKPKNLKLSKIVNNSENLKTS